MYPHDLGKPFPQIYLAVVISLPLAAPEASPEALASPEAYASNYGYYASPVVADVAPSSQYHAQDDAGQYNFGFTSPDQVTVSHITTELTCPCSDQV